MFEDLSKYNFILSNSLFTDKENQKTEKENDKIIKDLNKENGNDKYKVDLNKEIKNEKYNIDLNKENYFYSFINKKRKRYFSNKSIIYINTPHALIPHLVSYINIFMKNIAKILIL